MKKLFSLPILILMFSLVALGDIRIPDKPKPTPKGKQMEMLIEVTSRVNEPTLVIKKSSAKMLRAALDEAEGIDNSTNASIQNSNSGSLPTIVAGLFLALAIVFGGVWVIRSKPSKLKAGLFLFAVLSGTSALVVANVAPPRNFGITKSLFVDEFQGRAFARGKVQIQIINDNLNDNSDIRLFVPREPLTQGEK